MGEYIPSRKSKTTASPHNHRLRQRDYFSGRLTDDEMKLFETILDNLSSNSEIKVKSSRIEKERPESPSTLGEEETGRVKRLTSKYEDTISKQPKKNNGSQKRSSDPRKPHQQPLQYSIDLGEFNTEARHFFQDVGLKEDQTNNDFARETEKRKKRTRSRMRRSQSSKSLSKQETSSTDMDSLQRPDSHNIVHGVDAKQPKPRQVDKRPGRELSKHKPPVPPKPSVTQQDRKVEGGQTSEVSQARSRKLSSGKQPRPFYYRSNSNRSDTSNAEEDLLKTGRNSSLSNSSHNSQDAASAVVSNSRAGLELGQGARPKTSNKPSQNNKYKSKYPTERSTNISLESQNLSSLNKPKLVKSLEFGQEAKPNINKRPFEDFSNQSNQSKFIPDSTPSNQTSRQSSNHKRNYQLSKSTDDRSQTEKPSKSKTLYLLLVRQDSDPSLFEVLDSLLGPEGERSLEAGMTDQSMGMESATVVFPNQAQAERSYQLLQQHGDAGVKLLCSWYPLKRRIDCLTKYWKDVETHPQDIVKEHHDKINQVKKLLKTCPEDEREAFGLKKEELLKQMQEFKRYQTTVRKRLLELACQKDERIFFSSVELLMINFGVECSRLKLALPIYARRTDLLQIVHNNQVVIVRGETGSGKSTQLVQYLSESGQYSKGLIACSQPRKVACSSLAERVAEELITSVGQLVGVKAGMKKRISKETQIVFTTHHTLLNECLSDPLFKAYSCLMIDEVHERSIYTDILMSILKNCLPKRPDLKVVIASATIDVQIFSQYFTGAPVLEVSGRAFPVEIVWQPKHYQWTDTVREIVSKAVEVHRTEGPGDILAFVTTGMETEKCRDSFQDIMANWNNYECLMLHGQLPPEEQKLIFKPLREGQRKIIFSTNSAETSLTIPGIKYVIDSGLVKEMEFDPRKNMNTLVVVPVSRSSADQRKGRAGRTAPGKCFRLYTREDYRKMKATSTPEILRVHLSQTLLMLYEMNLTTGDCEFVESPPETAIQNAKKTLEELGCIKEDKITDSGKWLVKIPLEPRFACMIRKGYEMGFVYDTIVFTALCSSSGSIFYRGGNEKQQKRSDLKKLRFCHPKGDAFTCLKVYKEWQSVPERQKNKWCFENSINSKSLRGARDLVKEICDIFKVNWSINVTQNFSTEPELEEALQKIILFSFYENIAHYLGHVRMGYYIPNLSQRVFVHPSSALKSLNDTSAWLVFINILKTSRDYITIVTPVEETWIRWITQEKINQFDIDEAKKRSICSIRKEFFGATTFSFFVGPGYTKLRAYEEELYDAVQTPVVVEANRGSGEVKFICAFNPELPDSLITEWIDQARSHVLQRTMEYKVGTNIQAGGVRIVLGLGGEGQLILMPDEYRSVHIKKWDRNNTTIESIQQKFGKFGDIVDCWEDKRSYHRWGRVTFARAEYAAAAVARTQNDELDAADPEFKIHKNASFQYQATIEWLRRKPTGLVFVDMDILEAQKAVALRQVNILGSSCSLSMDKKTRKTLLIHKVPTDVTEQDVLYSFPSHGLRDAITKISIIREKVTTSPHEVQIYRQQIVEAFREFDNKMNFVVDVLKPFDSNIQFKAFIKFQDALQGTSACDELRGRLFLNQQRAYITPKLSTSLTVPGNVYRLLNEEVDAFLSESKDSGYAFRTETKDLGNERKVINISTSDSTVLVRIRTGLAAILQGEVRECWRNENYRHLFLKSGREFLRGLEKRTDTIIQLDTRLFTIRIYGKEENITKTQTSINQYLNGILEGDGNREIKLNGETQPKGLMKTLVTRYDLELEGFIQESGLRSALLIHHTQTLKISGHSESLEKALKIIDTICEELRTRYAIERPEADELPDCCVCFCPPDTTDQLYRLEYCGHVYCLECLKLQVTVAIQNKDIPVLCGNCQHPLVWSDLEFCFKRLQISPLTLVSSAVSTYMSKNKDGYRHCLTPGCPMVYRVTEQSSVFTCNECGVRICTACHIEYHDGLSCTMLTSLNESEIAMEKFLKDHAKTIKKCPKCSTPIEKKSGCNHMTCTGCKTHFCWICCALFTSTRATYDHLTQNHNGIFDDNV